jgi:hypothetical protein
VLAIKEQIRAALRTLDNIKKTLHKVLDMMDKVCPDCEKKAE